MQITPQERILRNYHTHTSRCHHAQGADEDYVLTAIEMGYTTLGFTDHTPWPYRDGHVSSSRMTEEELPGYVASIRALQEKYADRIQILIGLECEPFPEYYEWLRDIREQYRLDYFIMGNHMSDARDRGMWFGQCATPDDLKRYTESTVAGMESGLFAYLAHPEMAWSNYPQIDEACLEMSCTIACEAEKLHMPLEYNLQGNHYRDTGVTHGLGYPHEAFWQIAREHDIQAIVGVDAHRPAMLTWTDRLMQAQDWLRGLGIHVLEQLSV